MPCIPLHLHSDAARAKRNFYLSDVLLTVKMKDFASTKSAVPLSVVAASGVGGNYATVVVA